MAKLLESIARLRTSGILLVGVVSLALQPGPLAGQAVGSRHVDRFLDELPTEDSELPKEVELQCHLISLVSDAVTLRAAEIDGNAEPGPHVGSALAVSHLELPKTVVAQLDLDASQIEYRVRPASSSRPRAP